MDLNEEYDAAEQEQVIANLEANQIDLINENADLRAQLKFHVANADFNGRRAVNQAVQLRQLNEAIQRRNYTVASLRTRLVDAERALDYLRGETPEIEILNDDDWAVTVNG